MISPATSERNACVECSDCNPQSDLTCNNNQQQQPAKMYGVDPPLTMKRVRSQNSQKNPRNKVVVRVPATSANMGPGFDSFGFAVDLENELVLERGAFKVDIIGEGETSLPRDESNAII